MPTNDIYGDGNIPQYKDDLGTTAKKILGAINLGGGGVVPIPPGSSALTVNGSGAITGPVTAEEFKDANDIASTSQLDALHNRGAGTFSAAASFPIVPAEGCKYFTYFLTLGIGAGSYNLLPQLSNTGRMDGDKIQLVVSSPASTNPILEVQDFDGNTIYTRVGSGLEYTYPLWFTFDSGTSQFKSDQGEE